MSTLVVSELQHASASSANITLDSSGNTTINGTLSGDGSSLTGIATGKVLQVVQGTYSTEVQSTSTTYIDTGLSTSITPSATTSKILILSHLAMFADDGTDDYAQGKIKLFRGTTSLHEGYYGFYSSGGGPGINSLDPYDIVYLDSPATTSSTTYKYQFACRYAGRTAKAQYSSIPSVLILMEIGA